MKIFLTRFFFFFFLSMPINNTLIKSEVNSSVKGKMNGVHAIVEDGGKIIKQERQLHEMSILDVLLCIILIYLLYNAPIWAIVLFTFPVIFHGMSLLYDEGEAHQE